MLTSRPATTEEVIKQAERDERIAYITGNGVIQFHTARREVPGTNEHGVAYKTTNRSKIRWIGGLPHVRHAGETHRLHGKVFQIDGEDVGDPILGIRGF